jgi:hypothetical protein
VVVDEPANGDVFGFASMLDQTAIKPKPSRWKKRREWKYRAMT